MSELVSSYRFVGDGLLGGKLDGASIRLTILTGGNVSGRAHPLFSKVIESRSSRALFLSGKFVGIWAKTKRKDTRAVDKSRERGTENKIVK